jgi:tetratricopeptide (TPR) repeat protein
MRDLKTRLNNRGWAALLLGCLCLTAYASDNAAVWKRLNREGKNALKANDFAKAEPLLLKAAAAAEAFGPEDERYAESYRPLAIAAEELRDYPTADLAYTRLAYADGKRLGTNDIKVAEDLLGYVEVTGFTEEFMLGREALERAKSIVEMTRGKFSRSMGRYYFVAGNFELQENNLPAAETNFTKALEILDGSKVRIHFSGADIQMKQSYFDPPQAFVATVLGSYALCQRKEKNYGAAEASLLRSIEMLEREYGSSSPNLFNSLSNLALTYLDDGKLPEAEKTARRAVSVLRTIDPSNPVVQPAHALLAKILKREGK